MPTFAPPVHATEVPPTLPEGDRSQSPLQWRLFRHYSARPAGANVYVYWTDDTHRTLGDVSEVDPVTVYAADGTVDYNQWDRLAWVFWGGHSSVVIPQAVADVLVAAGYSVT